MYKYYPSLINELQICMKNNPFQIKLDNNNYNNYNNNNYNNYNNENHLLIINHMLNFIEESCPCLEELLNKFSQCIDQFQEIQSYCDDYYKYNLNNHRLLLHSTPHPPFH